MREKVNEIATWDRPRCAAEWSSVVGHPPQRVLSLGLLRRALAFELQCKELNGHSAAVKRQLRSALPKTPDARVAEQGSPASAPPLTLGTQLVREWNGRIYRVLVTDDGFALDGTSFRSLSAVAKRITGAEWSGPRFFGLRKR